MGNEGNGPNSASPFADQFARTSKLNSLYEDLAFELNDGDKGNFLSGWQCVNPYNAELFLAVKRRAETVDYSRYTYFDDDAELPVAITAHHHRLDGVAPEAVFCGSGSTSLLHGFASLVKKWGVEVVHFVPPMYFTLHLAFDRFGIRTTAVADRQPFEEGFELRLPDTRNSVLILTDPVWYTGTPIARGHIEAIAAWQKHTSSIIFVDGSLQYLGWNDPVEEATARLDRALTFRLICPSKQLSAHGYRFAYVLLPEAHEQEFAWVYTNIFGPTSADSIAFAHEAVQAIAEGELPRKLAKLVSSRHRRLRESRAIQSVIEPSCGYFVFEKVNVPLPGGYLRVEGKFFDQENFPGYNKINLLSPAIRILGAGSE